MKSGYIMPHPPVAVYEVGYNETEKMRDTLDAYQKASEMIRDEAPETIVIISPHAPMFSDGFYIAGGTKGRGDLARFGAPQCELLFDYDSELRDEVVKLCDIENIAYGIGTEDNDDIDHGTIVPLWFVTKEYRDFKLLRISPTYLDSSVLLKMGGIIERAAAHIGRKITILASADLSHKLKEEGPYKFAPEGPEFDAKITQAMKDFNIEEVCKLMDDHDFLNKAGQCGTPSVTMLFGAIKDYKVSPCFLSYEGPFGVGYAICAYNCEDECVRLAKKSLESYVRDGKQIEKYKELPEEKIPEFMKTEQAGTFVCLKKHGELRGCIGTFLPTTDCIADEIIRLAVEAGCYDPRFPEVKAEELGELDYTVDILSTPEAATISDLDVKRYGVIVSNGTRRGLLLPNLEGVDTIEYQLAVALAKAGISPEEGFDIERFTVERHFV